MSPLRIIQEDKKDPVLLIHGLGAQAGIWDRIGPQVPSRLVVELYGHGAQQHFPPSLSIRNTVADLHTFLKAHKYSGLPVVGHGLGGLIGLQLAREHSRYVRSLALIDTPTWQTGWKMAHRIMLHVVRDDFLPSVKHHMESLCRDESLLDGLISMGQATHPRAYYLYLRDMFSHDYRNMLSDIRVPVLGIFTRSLVHKDKELDRVNTRFAYSRLEDYRSKWMQDSRHFAMLEQPDGLSAILKSFWKG